MATKKSFKKAVHVEKLYQQGHIILSPMQSTWYQAYQQMSNQAALSISKESKSFYTLGAYAATCRQ